MVIRLLSAVVFLVCTAPAAYAGQDRSGILLLAHGGSSQWNERVMAVAGAADRTQPTEVAFGMASRASIQAAIDRLTARGVTEVIAVPLFVSSHSSVITTVRASAPFGSVDDMTVRDDAGPALREAATRELREKVAAQRAAVGLAKNTAAPTPLCAPLVVGQAGAAQTQDSLTSAAPTGYGVTRPQHRRATILNRPIYWATSYAERSEAPKEAA